MGLGTPFGVKKVVQYYGKYTHLDVERVSKCCLKSDEVPLQDVVLFYYCAQTLQLRASNVHLIALWPLNAVYEDGKLFARGSKLLRFSPARNIIVDSSRFSYRRS